MFVTTGTGIPPYVIFRQALDAGDLPRIRSLAAAMPHISLQDALRICLLMRDHDGYEKASVRYPVMDAGVLNEAATRSGRLLVLARTALSGSASSAGSAWRRCGAGDEPRRGEEAGPQRRHRRARWAVVA